MSQCKPVTFDCGHTAYLPYDDPDLDDRSRKYWRDQSVPRMAGGVAACPCCITNRRSRGEIRTVTSVGENHV